MHKLLAGVCERATPPGPAQLCAVAAGQVHLAKLGQNRPIRTPPPRLDQLQEVRGRVRATLFR